MRRRATLLAFALAAPAHAATIDVPDARALPAALDRARSGDEIRLAPGRYGAIRIADRHLSEPLRITSADPARPAVFASLHVRDVSGLTLVGLAFDGRGGALADGYQLMVGGSTRVTVDRSRFDDPARARTITAGIMVRDSADVTVSASRFTRLWHGIVFLDSRNVRLLRNEFDGVQTDGIRGGGTSNLLVAENFCTRFAPRRADHPDCIQVWTTNTRHIARNIVLRDNLMVRGRGGYPIQGVFVRDTYLTLPFEDLRVSGNLAVGLQYNAVAVNGGRAPRVTANEVIAYRDIKSYVVVRNTRNAAVSGNRAMLYLFLANRGLAARGNRINAVDDRSLRQVLPWLDARPAMRDAAGPSLAALIAEARAQ